ncbi:MAG TPA: DUF1330 domain-containing protein [Candidatus Limnocylindrales bacterium]|nr:DUF1330 domain-containing protein [Candidatus Limnocylindrales bacterium]
MARTASEIDALIEELSAHGLGGINPSLEQLRELVTEDRDGPLQFVNLLEYHDVARYPAGHALADAGLTGAEAYARYGAVAFAHVTRRGGRLTLYNDVEQSIIGDGGRWHQIATMEYPNTEAFIDMLRDPDYTAALVHRDAGLARTIVVVSRPLLPA